MWGGAGEEETSEGGAERLGRDVEKDGELWAMNRYWFCCFYNNDLDEETTVLWTDEAPARPVAGPNVSVKSDYKIEVSKTEGRFRRLRPPLPRSLGSASIKRSAVTGKMLFWFPTLEHLTWKLINRVQFCSWQSQSYLHYSSKLFSQRNHDQVEII